MSATTEIKLELMSLSNTVSKIRDLTNIVFADNSLTYVQKFDSISEAVRFLPVSPYHIKNLDIDMFQRFNHDEECVAGIAFAYGESDTLSYNFVTAYLIESEYYEYGEIIFVADLIRYLEAKMMVDGESLFFNKDILVDKVDEDGDIYEEWENTVITITKKDIEAAKKWCVINDVYLIKFQGEEV